MSSTIGQKETFTKLCSRFWVQSQEGQMSREKNHIPVWLVQKTWGTAIQCTPTTTTPWLQSWRSSFILIHRCGLCWTPLCEQWWWLNVGLDLPVHLLCNRSTTSQPRPKPDYPLFHPQLHFVVHLAQIAVGNFSAFEYEKSGVPKHILFVTWRIIPNLKIIYNVCNINVFLFVL